MEADTNGGSSNQQFTCEICIEPTSKRFRNADKCSHPFCTDCMISYIQVKLDDNNVGHIKCPALNCDHTLEPLSCASIIGPTLFSRWMDVLCEEAIVGREKCYCPNRTCNVPILNECGEDPKKSKCPSCKEWFCFHCKSGWHAGFRCEESRQYRDVNDVAFGRLVESENWKRCPRCRHFVERTLGCSAINCRCGIRFCYICGASPCSCYPPTLCEQICVCIIAFLFIMFLLWLDPAGNHPLPELIRLLSRWSKRLLGSSVTPNVIEMMVSNINLNTL